MRKLSLLLLLALASPARASDVFVGTLVSSGASVNNLTTASPFQLPQGPILLQCSAAVYVYSNKDATSAVATSSLGLKIAADVIYPSTTTPSRSVVAILPVSGSASCKVFAVYGDTASRRYIPSGSGGTAGSSSPDPARDDAANSYLAYVQKGSPGFECANAGCLFRGAPASVNNNATLWFSLTDGWNFGNQLNIAAGNVLKVDGVYPYQSNIPWVIRGPQGMLLEVQNSAPATCGSSAHPQGDQVQVVATATSDTRICWCVRLAGPGAYRWENMHTHARGSTDSDCPESA